MRPVGERAICKYNIRQRNAQVEKAEMKTYLADGENVVNVQTLEQRPHREVDVHQAATKIEPAWETCDNLQTRVARLVLRTGIEPDEVAGARRGMGKDLGDLQGMRLDVFGEARP